MKMMKTKGIRRWAFALLTAGALGFGGTQAFAAPGEPAARACNPDTCRSGCIRSGAFTGRCVGGFCACAYT
jgi:hypothetical protein